MPVAIGAFFAIDVLFAALIVTAWFLTVPYMLRPIVAFLQWVLSAVPVVGDDLAKALGNLAGSVENSIQQLVTDAYRAAATPFIEMMSTYANAHSGDAYSQRITAGQLTNAVLAVYSNTHYGITQSTADAINHAVTENVNNTNNYITNVVGVTQQYVDDSYTQLAGWANDAVQSLYHDVVDADGRVVTLANQTASDIAAEHSYASDAATAAESAAVTAANAYTQAAFTTVENFVVETRDWTQGQIHDAVAAENTTMHETVKGVDDKLSLGIAAATATIASIATDVDNWRNNCGDPLCEGLLDTAKLFSGIGKLFELGAITAFLTAAIADPVDTAADTVAVADTLEAPAKALIGAITGR